METQRVTIDLKGVQRNVSPVGAPAGTCKDIVNLRPKDGGWRPVLPKTVLWSGSMWSSSLTTSKVFSHNALPENEYIILRYTGTATNVEHASFNEGTGEWELEKTIVNYSDIDYGEIEIRDISFINDAMIIHSNIETVYSLYKDGEYIINKSIDDLPDIRIAAGNYDGHTFSAPDNEFDTLGEAIAGYYAYIKEQAEEHSRYEGNIMLIAAYRMTDGTIIKQSTPLLNRTGVTDSEGASQGPSINYVSADLKYKVYGILVSKANYYIREDIPEYWTSVIESIDVFAARIPFTDQPDEYKEFEQYSLEFERKDVEIEIENVVFRRINSFNLSLYDIAGGNREVDITEDIDLANLHTREALPVDQLTYHQLGFDRSKVYNSRVHAANINIKMFQGHMLDIPHPQWQLTNNDKVIETSLHHIAEPPDTGGGTYSVVAADAYLVFRIWVDVGNDEEEISLRMPVGSNMFERNYNNLTDRAILLNKLITYPDPRAKRFEIILHDSGSPSTLIRKGVFKKHPLYPFSYYYYKVPEVTKPWAQTYYTFELTGYCDSATYSNTTVVPDLDNKVRYDDPNRLQLSELENPFIWPARNSYRIGGDKYNKIIDLGIQAAPTSEGQFGEYPLIVFAANGIYLVNQGTGDVVYSNIIKISALKVNDNLNYFDQDNVGGVVFGIDGAIIFTTKDGLYLLQGREVRELTRNVIGNISYDTEDTETDENPIENMYLTFSTDLEYIKTAKFAWDNQHREIIISNWMGEYHYRYSPQSGLIFMVSGSYRGFLLKDGAYQGYHFASGNLILSDIDTDDTSEDEVRVYFKSNPQLLVSSDFKKIQRLMLYCDAQTDNYYGYLNLFVFGGNIINGTTDFIKLQENRVDAGNHPIHMITGRTPVSMRYFVFMLSGQVNKDSVFQHLEAEVTPVLAGRLR